MSSSCNCRPVDDVCVNEQLTIVGMALQAALAAWPLVHSACEQDHQAEKAMELGVELQQRGLEPNGAAHQVEKAMVLDVEMQQRGLAGPYPDEADASAGGKCPQTDTTLGSLQQRGLEPNVITDTEWYHMCDDEEEPALLAPDLEHLAMKAADLESRLAGLAREANKVGPPASVQRHVGMQTVLTLPGPGIGCAVAHHAGQALNLAMEWMASERLEAHSLCCTLVDQLLASESTYNGAVSACDKSDKAAKAIELFDEMQ